MKVGLKARLGIAAMMGAFVLAGASIGARAQDAELVALGEGIWKEKASCKECHGSLANGVPDNHQAPKGADLRETQLSEADLAITIKCGRPSTAMPYFDRRAYTDKRCYNSTAADLGTAIPPAGAPVLSPREINALAAFIVGQFKGKPDPTYEDCIDFWGEAASTCDEFPKAGG